MRQLPSLVAGIAAAFVAGPVVAQSADAPRYGYHYWDGPWQGWFMGPLMMIFWLVILVVVIVLLVRWLGGHGPSHTGTLQAPPVPTPLDILKERFAKGEIDKEEYEDRRRILEE